MADKTMISMAFPTELLNKIDQQAKAEYTSRNDYIRRTLVGSISKKKQDEDSAWQELLEGADELAALATKAGYRTDADFGRLANEIKQDRRQAI